MNKLYKSKISFEPLFKEGDKFIIIKFNTDKQMLPITAMRLKDKQFYGFEDGELELIENG